MIFSKVFSESEGSAFKGKVQTLHRTVSDSISVFDEDMSGVETVHI
jgi:hypothetical protein